MNLEEIRRKVQLRRYRISWTHTEKLRRRQISSDMIERAIETGVLIDRILMIQEDPLVYFWDIPRKTVRFMWSAANSMTMSS